MTPFEYDTASQAVNGLVKRGYTANFSLMTENECLICHSPALELSPDDFEIDEIYRFEGMIPEMNQLFLEYLLKNIR